MQSLPAEARGNTAAGEGAESRSVNDRHRVVVDLDNGLWARKLIHPEGGCDTAEMCGLCGRAFDDEETTPCYDCKPPIPASHRECWVQGWFDNEGSDILWGRLDLVVEPEWDLDHCTLHVVAAGVHLSPRKPAVPESTG